MTTTIEANDDPAVSPEDVLTLLRDEVRLYAKLEGYTSRQRLLITGDGSGELLTLLGDRQKLSAELIRVGVRLAPVREDWDSYRRRLSSAARQEAQRLIGEIKGCLLRIMKSDEQDARLLSARKQAVAKSLRTTHATVNALSAYRSGPHAPGRFDRLDEAS